MAFVPDGATGNDDDSPLGGTPFSKERGNSSEILKRTSKAPFIWPRVPETTLP